MRVLLLGAMLLAAAQGRAEENSLITFGSEGNFAARRPIVVAHRGGVVTSQSHECSLTAMRLAAEAGYNMVELDVRRSRDGIPIVFHDGDLMKACGRRGAVQDFLAEELESMPYLAGNDSIVRFDTALAACRRWHLGVMLDLKEGQESEEFLAVIDRLLIEHGLEKSTISITGNPLARQFLKYVRFTPTADEMRRLRAGEALDLSHRFWFGIPERLQPGDLEKLKSAQALILPAINTFRYPADRHMDLAREDIRRLTEAGVHGFQIDSIYFPLLER